MRAKPKDGVNGRDGSDGGSNGSDGGSLDLQSRLRALPSVDELRRALESETGGSTPHVAQSTRDDALAESVVTAVARTVLDQARTQIRAGENPPSRAQLCEDARRLLDERSHPVLRPVLNATGVIVNTNLGRAPLAEPALHALARVARGYANLEYNLDEGARGSRQAAVRSLLCELTGAQDALVVNNNAAAVLLALTALAQGREVVLSRGELVEIGGGFRVPDVMQQSGARLVEVGTTNRTRVADYEKAITAETAALLAVHPSNFRIVGFAEGPALRDLAVLAHARGLPLIHDLGSGALLRSERFGLAHEPMPQESLAAGADLVCFSGDKLLGGPQAGILVGSHALIEALARHPLARALRIDKLSLAALEATLNQYRDQHAEAIPVWSMIAQAPERLHERAERWAERMHRARVAAEVLAGESTIGGGSLPGETLPTWLCAIIQAPEADHLSPRATNGHGDGAGINDVGLLAARLRQGEPPVVARVLRKRLLLDPRTVPSQMDETLIAAVLAAVERMANETPPSRTSHIPPHRASSQKR